MNEYLIVRLEDIAYGLGIAGQEAAVETIRETISALQSQPAHALSALREAERILRDNAGDFESYGRGIILDCADKMAAIIATLPDAQPEPSVPVSALRELELKLLASNFSTTAEKTVATIIRQELKDLIQQAKP